MQDFDPKLLKKFRTEVQATGSGTFKDPNTPYQVSVEPSKAGHTIKVVNTSKRWYGRLVLKHEHPLEAHVEIADNGPVATAILMLTLVIEGKVPLG
ncbi:hypothetical protein ELI15_14235 [Rhizobium ruizarguesonis]|uniref:hypothetical protein n=1 Tax=Rhizobium ruizarguesonis TaxID=2081791 RepID=UPI00102FCA86|nr:hypothetical protein [Rhizobium ruizarguesonis]TAW65448.1 hypothetical protein ELI15_14235 [Rhizobium ruizarguesonis]